MVLVIGTDNCPRCDIVVNRLTQLGKDFKYLKSNEVAKGDMKQFKKNAQAKGIMSFPLIIKNDDIVELKEVI